MRSILLSLKHHNALSLLFSPHFLVVSKNRVGFPSDTDLTIKWNENTALLAPQG